MPRGYRRYILLALGWMILGASPAQNNDGKRLQRHSHGEAHQAEAAPRVVKPAVNAPQTETAKRGCEGADDSNLSCDALSVKADIRQASDADWQAYASVAGVFIGLLTLLAAGFAALLCEESGRAHRIRSYRRATGATPLA